MKKRLPALVAVLVVINVLWFVLFRTSPSPTPGAFYVDLEGLRATADAGADELPTDVRVLHLADGALPGFFVIAGGASGSLPAVYASFQVVMPDAGSVIIDTAYDRAGWEAIDGKLSTFHDDAWERLEKAMLASSAIVLTHEHPDHIGGVARSKHALTLAKGPLRMTKEQVDFALAESKTGFTKEAAGALTPIAYDKLFRVAPGVVLQRAPGHSPGSQLIYVHRADGKELLFVGDIAWNQVSIDQQRMRPLAASLFLAEQRQPVIDQLGALHQLQAEHPEVQIVIAHDGKGLERVVASGAVNEGFIE